MERHQIIDAMTGLKLYGMRASFDEIAGKGLARRDELYPLLGSLIRAELAHRQSRSINYRISGARFPVLKDLEAFIFEGSPVDEVQIRELAAGDFIDAKDARTDLRLVEIRERTAAAGHRLRDPVRLHLSDRTEGRGLVALSDASPQTPSPASRQSLARHHQGSSVDL